MWNNIRGKGPRAALVTAASALALAGCLRAEAIPPPEPADGAGTDILFLHHSTGHRVWDGGVPEWFAGYNAANGTDYEIARHTFPTAPYPWENYPYDYWNLWVDHAGDPYAGQVTLESLTKDYEVIVWKNCYFVSDVLEDVDYPDITSNVKTAENYRLQFEELREKMREFPDTTFVVWTGPAQVAGATNEGDAQRADAFFDWIRTSWDEPGDNIFLWDFRELETEGGLYLLDEYAASSTDSHPNSGFAERVAPLMSQRIVDVLEGRGDTGSLTGV